MQVVVPKSVKAIVLLNLQSYAGGRDLWGLKDTAKDAAKGWKVPIFNDGLIEVTVSFLQSLPWGHNSFLAIHCGRDRRGPLLRT